MLSDWTRPELLNLANLAGTIIVAIIGLVAVRWGKLNHITMNSRLDQYIKLTQTSSKAEGVKQERDEQSRKGK